jgi:hypothetical protein
VQPRHQQRGEIWGVWAQNRGSSPNRIVENAGACRPQPPKQEWGEPQENRRVLRRVGETRRRWRQATHGAWWERVCEPAGERPQATVPSPKSPAPAMRSQ